MSDIDTSPRKCKNCDHPVSENYCGKCGQSIETGRINWHYLLHEFQHSILHVDKGIFYTIKELLLRPDAMLKGYLEGKRVNHFKPFAFVLILGTIYGFIAHFTGYYPEAELSYQQAIGDVDQQKEISQSVMEWLYSHYSFTMLAFLPFLALSSFLFFRKNEYNYFEHLVIYAYIIGIQILILLLSYPLYYIFDSKILYLICILLLYIYNVWVIALLFKSKSWIGVIAKALLSITFASIILFILALFVGVLAIVLVNIV